MPPQVSSITRWEVRIARCCIRSPAPYVASNASIGGLQPMSLAHSTRTGGASMNESMLWQDQLLATKIFVPASPQTLIRRPRLTALLDEGLQRKLTLLSAPAGFGKTTLLSTWVQTRAEEDAPVAWSPSMKVTITLYASGPTSLQHWI